MNRYRFPLAALLTSALALNPLLAVASPAFNTDTLIGTRSDTAEQILQNNGYQQVHTENGSDRNWVSWWNGDRQDCLVTSEKSDRYVAVQPTIAHECQQYASSGGISKGTALALAAGAAALIGGVALYNHNKHHHDGNNDQANQNDYQQGYQDGLNNRSSSNGGDAYTSGYNAGIDEYNRQHAGRHHRHGRDAYVDVSDLVGVRASYAESDLTSRGFRNIDGSKGWHNAYTTWWNPRASECVQVVTRDGRYDRVNVVDANNCA
ncbi:hypothetical protein [Jeongeupia naejangsanensis]|uniref:Secreted protein n=1 Tax=Jeongeupia naejangsanensis TaxID=613195 RepID=A0ABS2BMF9_9NEIS|nr:hypothetical protein [Jeongeupia naejangsanensis]MBM3116801.1 hypothetical protein [Jeongeupia naejangsanensis]